MYEIIEIEPIKFQVREAGSKYEMDLKERTFEFAVAIIELLKMMLLDINWRSLELQ